MSGKPAELYLDNAAEFKSEALRRGCEQHGVKLRYRPPGQPHYGGIVERVIGTIMQMVHELPGTMFDYNAALDAAVDDRAASLQLLRLFTGWCRSSVCYERGRRDLIRCGLRAEFLPAWPLDGKRPNLDYTAA